MLPRSSRRFLCIGIQTKCVLTKGEPNILELVLYQTSNESNGIFEKMKVLEINRQAFILNGILPTPQNATTAVKLRNKLFGIFSFVTVLVGLLASINFVRKFVTTDLEGSFYALFQVSGYFSQVYTMSVALIRWRQFSSIFTKIQDFYDTCKWWLMIISVIVNFLFASCLSFLRYLICFEFRNSDHHLDGSKYMEKANKTSELVSKFLLRGLVMMWVVHSLSLSALSLINMYFSSDQLDVNLLYVPHKYA